jgi:hypothetical protein
MRSALLKTIDWLGLPVHTRVRFEPSGGRLYVRASGTPDWVVRLWNNPTVWVTPCTRFGRTVAQPILSRARVAPGGPGDADELWIELTPTSDNGRAI